MLECLLFATSAAVENIDSTCTEAANYEFFGRYYVKKTSRRIAYSIRLAEHFRRIFGGRKFGGGLGIYLCQAYCSCWRFLTSIRRSWNHAVPALSGVLPLSILWLWHMCTLATVMLFSENDFQVLPCHVFLYVFSCATSEYRGYFGGIGYGRLPAPWCVVDMESSFHIRITEIQNG